MKPKVSFITFFLLFGMFSGSSVRAEDGNFEQREYVCMMQDSILATPGIAISHEGKTYYGCCPMCNQKIQEHPERYTKAVDPVTRAIVDKASALIYAFQGRAYYFESESSRSEFAKQPLKYIAGTL